MHPEVEGVIRACAREYLAVEVMNKGPYTFLTEKRVLSFDDIYFMGIFHEAQKVALDNILQREERDYPIGFVDEDLQKRAVVESSRLAAELYNSNPEEMQKRWHDIHQKFAACAHERL